jgi:Domain of unknown function (DUF5122) beta-propeller
MRPWAQRNSKRTRAVWTGLVVAALAITSLALGQATAQAGTNIPNLPITNAADNTPRVVDDATVSEAGVREFRQVGSTMYAGGDFHTVLSANRATTYTRQNLFSFNASTGGVTSWAPALNGPVYSMEPSADGRYLYIGGEFTTFNGVAVNRLVKYDLQTQSLVTAFNPPRGSRISDLQMVGSRLFVAGTFPGGIMAVNPTTGARDPYLDGIQATGQESGYNTRVHHFSINPAGTRMVVIGSFTAIGGQPRQQAAMIRLNSSPRPTVSPWTSPRWNEDCASGEQWYARDVDWSPDGSYFAIVTSGAGAPLTEKLCDTISRWNPVESANQQPVWINYSGGDTFHSVVATNLAVIVGGHFRWLDNPQGRDTKGPGAVDRRGLGAVSPADGKALAWNPTKSVEGGHGAWDLYFTDLGLWVGHFEQYLGSGNELHEGLGRLPFR